jgi:hypothetical protein
MLWEKRLFQPPREDGATPEQGSSPMFLRSRPPPGGDSSERQAPWTYERATRDSRMGASKKVGSTLEEAPRAVKKFLGALRRIVIYVTNRAQISPTTARNMTVRMMMANPRTKGYELISI